MKLSILLFALLSLSTAAFAAPRPEPAIDDILFPRRPINTRIMGVNAFVNDSRFGTIRQQFQEVRKTLRLGKVRVLFAWDDNVQPDPNIEPNFSFYDNIARGLPSGTEALVVLTGVPSWMSNPENWIGGDPRATFVEKWVKKVVSRYNGRKRLRSFQIWNEPNDENNPHNVLLELHNSPSNYLLMLQAAYEVSKEISPTKKIVSAATTSIIQNFPETLEYNEDLKELGAEEYLDVWGVHLYGSSLERLYFGVTDHLNSLGKPIWITESGKQGYLGQREYVERAWPLLKEIVPNIKRFYFYQFTDSAPAASTYGLRNLTSGKSISDLYIYLRDR